MKKIFLIFFWAFVFNFVWENLHSLLYVHYKNNSITELVLFRAAFVDALIILAMVFIFLKLPKKYRKIILLPACGFVVAVLLEKWALAEGRWAYNELMPIIPLLNIGLTPTVQLGFLGLLTYFLVEKKIKI